MLSGASILKRQILRGLRCSIQQVQPCGVDLTLSRVFSWSDKSVPAIVDFDNSHRRAAKTQETVFTSVGVDGGEASPSTKTTPNDLCVSLVPGTYLVEFNESVHMPLDCMGQLFTRSSLWRSGATVSAGVVDAGYQGGLGGLLEVRHPAGLVLYKNAKLVQMTVQSMAEGNVEKGYDGIYQTSQVVGGRDGQPI